MTPVFVSACDFQLSKEVTALSRGTVGEMRMGGGDTCLTTIDEGKAASKVEPAVVSKLELLNPFPFGLKAAFCGEGEDLKARPFEAWAPPFMR